MWKCKGILTGWSQCYLCYDFFLKGCTCILEYKRMCFGCKSCFLICVKNKYWHITSKLCVVMRCERYSKFCCLKESHFSIFLSRWPWPHQPQYLTRPASYEVTPAYLILFIYVKPFMSYHGETMKTDRQTNGQAHSYNYTFQLVLWGYNSQWVSLSGLVHRPKLNTSGS